MQTPVVLPGLVLRPVPADQIQPAGATGPLAEQARPPWPDEPDLSWPRARGRERPAQAAGPPDIDAIAERVITRLRRQQRLDRERRG